MSTPGQRERQPLVEKHLESSDDTINSSSSIIGSVKTDKPPTIKDDIIDTIRLGVPIFITRFSFVGKSTTDSALLGHVSREALSAAALSDLWTMCSRVLITGGVLSIFVSGAVGANNPKLAGTYLQVSLLVLGCLMVPVIICWNLTELVWIKFGIDPEIAKMAGYYARVLSVSVPASLVFSQVSQFFSAQRIMYPETSSAAFGLLMNLLLGLVFVLGIPFDSFSGYRFTACPIVTSAVTYFQLALLLGVFVLIKRLHEPCWGGWSWKECTWERIQNFSNLYFPAALSSASDFWRVAVIGSVAAKLGEEEVAVFNTSYRLMWISLIVVGSLASASGINMSIRLGRMDPDGARQAGYVGVGLSGFILAVLSVVIYWKAQIFGRIFTNDEVFLDLFTDASLEFTLTLFFMNLSIAIERVPYAMGRTTEVFWMGFIASWGGQVPGVILCVNYWRHDLVGLYSGMAIGYFMLVLLYGYIAITSDWRKYAEIAQLRSERPAVVEVK